MGFFSYFATTSEGGFHLNFDIIEANLINLGIILALLFVYGRKFISDLLDERKAKIVADLEDAETRMKNAKAALTKAQKDLEQAQKQAQVIREEAKVSAEKAKSNVLAQGREEIEKLKANAVKELDNEQAKVVADLKQRIAQLALERVESELRDRLDDASQSRLIDRSIAQLGGNS
ncbi:ATP synthase subunit b [[Leptolyngbya] sp. PCC 7376]|uniref:F0F1 ATP synthase subunit B n=1 Tax=[Leptolyngbya] sp. PCC 7376 TaxID=111781 RepID=UPI00029F0B1B|nr:F0F1 ATP synthase subunit B [[Leptolyngbya] sp. PCC 7376]AFY40493.1 ATP synthase subunit b [[Leptolyngbya] sp. PCC 7376]